MLLLIAAAGSRLLGSGPSSPTTGAAGAFSSRASIIAPSSTTLPSASCLNDSAPRLRCWRGNAWSVTIPGLPFVRGASRTHPARVLTWFIDRWAAEWQARIFGEHARRGYTHFVLSWPDSRDGNGQSVEQFVATAARVKQAGFYVAVFFGSKDFDPADDTAAGWATRADAVVKALLGANAIDLAIVCWECDAFNARADRLQEIINHFAGQFVPAGVPLYMHLQAGHASPHRDDGGAAFWRGNVGKLTGLLYQARPDWTAETLQARLTDVLERFAGRDGYPRDSGSGHPFDVVAWELHGSRIGTDGHPDEDDANRRGYEAACAPGPIPVMGFGNGARRPDGRPL